MAEARSDTVERESEEGVVGDVVVGTYAETETESPASHAAIYAVEGVPVVGHGHAADEVAPCLEVTESIGVYALLEIKVVEADRFVVCREVGRSEAEAEAGGLSAVVRDAEEHGRSQGVDAFLSVAEQ